MANLNVPAEVQLGIYKCAALLKINDEKARQVVKSGRLAMPYYSYRVQEVIPAALCAALTDADYLCTIYRGIHDMISKGLPLKSLWAELAGRVDGACKGKGGPMHLTFPSKGIMVTTGIVGSSMPIANGLAWASQLARDGRVSVATFGDGAANIGAFHEALNLAAVWKLPVIFVCQNNLYGEHTPYSKATACRQIAQRAGSYDIPGVRVDGNDPIAMYRVAEDAVKRARAGDGPTLIEAMTFRFFGHVFGDDDAYMDKQQKAAAVAADPVPAFRRRLLSQGLASESELSELESRAAREVDDAVEFALSSALPSVTQISTDVYAGVTQR